MDDCPWTKNGISLFDIKGCLFPSLDLIEGEPSWVAFCNALVEWVRRPAVANMMLFALVVLSMLKKSQKQILLFWDEDPNLFAFFGVDALNMLYFYGQTPQFASADADDMSEHQKTLCFVGQNAHVHDHGFHLATRSLATCALNVTTTTSSSSSTSSTSTSSTSSSS